MGVESEFNKQYYTSGCGPDYHSRENWLQFFRNIAAKITMSLQPRTVLDAGCAFGYLVEALREQGVDAWGVDVSEYAIGQASEHIRIFLCAQSAAEPLPEDFPQHFDLVVSIEMLEHVYEEEALLILDNLAQYADSFLISASCSDYNEETHFNVQPPAYWVEKFAERGFFEDTIYDGSYLTPQTILVTKQPALTLHRMAFNYKRAVWRAEEDKRSIESKLKSTQEEIMHFRNMILAKEAELAQVIAEKDAKLAELVTEKDAKLAELLSEKDAELEKVIQQIAEQENKLLKLKQSFGQICERNDNLEQLLADQWNKNVQSIEQLKRNNGDFQNMLMVLQGELAHIKNSKGFRILLELYRLKDRLFPPKSRWKAVCRAIYHTPQNIKNKTFYKRFFRKYNKEVIQQPKDYNMPAVPERYARWIFLNEPMDDELKLQSEMYFPVLPKISVVVPVYNTQISYFTDMVKSVQHQSYVNWELCLADGYSKNRDELREYINSLDDDRIQFICCPQNYGIAGNTNAALEHASGDYIAFLDHDDMLAPFALFEVVNCINHCPGVELIYSDDDRISENGIRSMPCFKPDFSFDHLRACNFIGHLTVASHSLFEKVGLLDSKYDGSQDYDFVLKASEQAGRIEHIPKILYHFRMHAQSVSMNENAKSYAYSAAKAAIQASLDRQGLDGTVEDGVITNSYRIRYRIEGCPTVTIIIPTMDHVSDLRVCVESILQKSTYKDYEILLVENNSKYSATFEYYEQLEKDKRIRVIRWCGTGFNYASLINFGVANATGEYIITLNNDTKIITPEWIEEMLVFAQRRDVGMVGGRLYYPDNTLWNAGLALDKNRSVTLLHNKIPRDSAGYYGRAVVVQCFSALAGACLMMRRDAYLDVGGCDDVNFKVAHNDIDLGLKFIQKGLSLIYTPFCEVYHYESKSRGSDLNDENLQRFLVEDKMLLAKWKDYLEYGDPYYNVNLSLENSLFETRAERIKYRY